PHFTIKKRSAELMHKFLTEFGMTPGPGHGTHAVPVEGEGPASRWSGFGKVPLLRIRIPPSGDDIERVAILRTTFTWMGSDCALFPVTYFRFGNTLNGPSSGPHESVCRGTGHESRNPSRSQPVTMACR